MESWKDPKKGKIVVRSYKVKQGQKIPVREGVIGRVKEITPGSKYEGKYLEGGYQQYEFLTKWEYDNEKWEDYLDMISEDTLI
ncbi:hypothetical protein SAMN04488096_1128 [Mesonia phycicola]|uniref:Uncharacterized protein n=1 Tax=Mesonia phycicola TaxID=579105 RepID=A0A1M6HIU6_9FLAO|nr:hypothetical protein [Mesonia phycicola]SHJ22107.1 hypothetical protein SAMN04488096_1128 [Mesonia phycicola]